MSGMAMSSNENLTSGAASEGFEAAAIPHVKHGDGGPHFGLVDLSQRAMRASADGIGVEAMGQPLALLLIPEVEGAGRTVRHRVRSLGRSQFKHSHSWSPFDDRRRYGHLLASVGASSNSNR